MKIIDDFFTRKETFHSSCVEKHFSSQALSWCNKVRVLRVCMVFVLVSRIEHGSDLTF